MSRKTLLFYAIASSLLGLAVCSQNTTKDKISISGNLSEVFFKGELIRLNSSTIYELNKMSSELQSSTSKWKKTKSASTAILPFLKVKENKPKTTST